MANKVIETLSYNRCLRTVTVILRSAGWSSTTNSQSACLDQPEKRIIKMTATFKPSLQKYQYLADW